jgi:hypothetical protein
MRSTEGTSSKFAAAELVAIRVRVRAFLSLDLLLEQRPNRVRERQKRTFDSDLPKFQTQAAVLPDCLSSK